MPSTIQSEQKIQWLFILTTIAIMFPFPVGSGILLMSTILLLIKIPLLPLIKDCLACKLLGAFFIVSSLGSLLAKNYLGFAITFALIIFSIYFIYYRKYVTKQTFELSLNIILGFSVSHAIYAALEAWFILPPIDYNAINALMVTWRDGRADSFFFNPNYYALFCAFSVLIASYKLYYSSSVKQYIRYGMVMLFNGFGMLFTLTRTILPSLLIAILAFVTAIHSQRLKKLMGVITVIILIVAVLFYSHIPRFDLEAIDEHIDIRTAIWQTSFQEFLRTPFIGQGPLTYMTIYEKYNSYATQHAHNLILDTLLNYGIIGFMLLSKLCYHLWQPVRYLKNNYQFRALYSLAMSFIVLVMVHGIMDVTIFWIQTLFVFLLVLLALPNIEKEANI